MAASTFSKVVSLIAKNGKDIEKLIKTAGAIVSVAAPIAEQVKPLIEDLDTDAIKEKAQKATEGVSKGAKALADKAGEGAGAVKQGASGAVGAAGAAFGKLTDAKNEFLQDLAAAKDEKLLQKSIQEARQSVLERPSVCMTLKEYDSYRAAESKASGVTGGFELPGCFVIATYKKLDFDKDLTDYTGVYVGKALNAIEGVKVAMSRTGNPDVYADVKYRQNVRIYIYNCLAESLDERFAGLYTTFAAGSSYNAGEFDAASEAEMAASVRASFDEDEGEDADGNGRIVVNVIK